MSQDGLRAAQQKMRAAGVNQTAIEVFSHYYGELEAGGTGLIAETELAPLTEPAHQDDIDIDDAAARDALAETVVIKLNGGLGTSMGMARAKSLLPVRGERTFLDLIVEQVRQARAVYDARLPLLFMNSFRTRADTLEALANYPDIATPGLPLDFLQNQEPKVLTRDLAPASWPTDPDLEWCPPGHGDIFPALMASGVLTTLLEQGYRYATVSNSDNLGAAPSARLAGWFAASQAPFAMEVCRRTAADRKGGHLAVRIADGRLVLREVAQTAPADMESFTDEQRHRYFNTNSLWFDLRALHDALRERNGVLGLPMIRNVKTLDPADESSPEVFQIETAMGAAIEVFEGAQAIEVDRSRFLPVKTTNDLLLLRSDAYTLDDDGALRPAVAPMPLVDLDGCYKKIADFDQRFPAGPPSLRAASSLTVRGDWTFGNGVVVRGNAVLADPGLPQRVGDGEVLSG